MPVTQGVLQTRIAGNGDVVAAKFSLTGELLRCTYVGGTGQDGADGVYISKSGHVVLPADFSDLRYASYSGGKSYDDGRSCFVDVAENIYIVGSTNGPGWPAVRAHQPTFAGGGGGKELCHQGGCSAGDVILAKIAKSTQ